MSKTNETLDLVMKNVWFDKIKSGEKNIEYREVKDTWTKRIFNIKGIVAVKKVVLSRDYRRKEQLMFQIKKIETLPTGINTDLKINNPVYAIHLGQLIGYYSEEKPIEKEFINLLNKAINYNTKRIEFSKLAELSIPGKIINQTDIGIFVNENKKGYSFLQKGWE